ncbi:zinc transporter ZntB [Halomonas halocynthiae]|uniref:zinc transporter ZntB n=1 Tax=Halomonas halocynthiae TaxID=176290 RepID=UPI00040FD58F|nr:zinc transporter ZntB [Halomonas halocynthiae]
MATHSATYLTGENTGHEVVGEDALTAAMAEYQLLWIHMDAGAPDTRVWLEKNLNSLDPLSLDALLQDETRPRAETMQDGTLINLRGVNTNPGADPEDMVSIRMWADERRIVTLTLRPLATITSLQDEVRTGNGPKTPGEFLCRLSELLCTRIESFLRNLEERVDILEADVLGEPDQELRQGITDARQDVILFRRFVAPQRDALAYLLHFRSPAFMTPEELRRLSEVHDRVIRVVEELDEFRDRLVVIRDELTNVMSERVNRNLYLLSVISLIFLPLGFLTGLLGINVGGIPGTSEPVSFWVVCAICVAVVALLLIVLRNKKWI